jgi:hypothetical protein
VDPAGSCLHLSLAAQIGVRTARADSIPHLRITSRMAWVIFATLDFSFETL